MSAIESLLSSPFYSGIESQSFTFGGAHGFVFTYPALTLKNKKTAFFGGWKWANNEDNKKLLQAFQSFSQEKKCSALIGPYDLSTYLSYRFKLDHFDAQPFSAEPHNTKEEVLLLENNGFKVIENYETRHWKSLNELRDVIEKQNPLFTKMIETHNLYLKSTSQLEIESQISDFYHVTHNIFKDNFLYNPIPEDFFPTYFSKILAPTVCWETTCLLKSQQTNKIVGYALNFKDSAQPNRLLIKTVGVLPEARQMGVSFLALVLEQRIDLLKIIAVCLFV